MAHYMVWLRLAVIYKTQFTPPGRISNITCLHAKIQVYFLRYPEMVSIQCVDAVAHHMHIQVFARQHDAHTSLKPFHKAIIGKVCDMEVLNRIEHPVIKGDSLTHRGAGKSRIQV